MKVKTHRISFGTHGNGEMVNITDDIHELLNKENIKSGILTVFVPGSTGALTTIEYEPGLIQDFPAMFDRIAPQDIEYKHDQTWHDGNGHSHCRASLVGPSITIPFAEKRMLVGTWQQVIFIDFDNRNRRRELIVQILGE